MKTPHTIPRLLAIALALIAASGGASECAPESRPIEESERLNRIEKSLAAASDYLIAAQSSDGAWRSDVYAAFKEGDALTPLALQALLQIPTDHSRQASILKGSQFLESMVREDGSIAPPSGSLTYPVYTAAGAVIVLSQDDRPESKRARDAWLNELRKQQLTENLGWQTSDPEYGGWGYAKDPPKRPQGQQPLGPLAIPNLSASTWALEALRAAGIGADDPAIQKAIGFVKQCQNLSDASLSDNPFDDGGFFFIQDDLARNKAGSSGADPSGHVRFASYGSTTADGLRALRLCGIADTEPRSVAAQRWLEKHFNDGIHPGNYAKNREATRAALYFYYCRSLALALRGDSIIGPLPLRGSATWADALSDELMSRQRSDGSWTNSVVDVREDDPILATSLAASALAIFRNQLTRDGH